MRYKLIDGWFDEHDAKCLEHIISLLPQRARWLEVGSYKGRSTVCLDFLAKQAGKNVTIDIIDTFEGDAHIGQANTYNEFLANTKHCNIGKIYKTFSHLVKPEFHYDAIYLDASHDYDSVLRDLKHFLPHTNILAGHDFLHYDVAKALRTMQLPTINFNNSYVVTT
jgi:predicted O-methyltransferase YrrM